MQLTIFSHLLHFSVGTRVQSSHGLCHFQYCFSHLPHMCYGQEAHVLWHYQYSVIYHTFAVGSGVQEAHVFCNFQ